MISDIILGLMVFFGFLRVALIRIEKRPKK